MRHDSFNRCLWRHLRSLMSHLPEVDLSLAVNTPENETGNAISVVPSGSLVP